MKKWILMLLAVLAVSMACKSTDVPPQNEPVEVEKNRSGLDLPDFVLNPPRHEDMLYGVGYAKMATFNNSKKFAEARAREDVSNQINVSVQGAIIDYTQESGNSESPQVLSFAESISKQITDTTLTGAEIVSRELDSEGGLWVLCQYPKANMLSSFEDAASSFERDEEAAFSEFKAQEALKFLENELSSNPTSSNPVKE